MPFSSLRRRRIAGLALTMGIAMAAGCGKTSAEPSPPASPAPASSGAAGCAIPFPAEVPVPEKLTIETCTPSEKITGFHGKAPLPDRLDVAFDALKGAYTAGGYAVYDNSSGKIRSIIFGGKNHRKGEIQLNPKDGYLAVSINLYPASMEE